MRIDPPWFRYCPRCGVNLPTGSAGKQTCTACGHRHYWSPTVGVAVVLIEEGRVLLGERRGGGWCVPCGYVEWGESIEEAARREFLEETGIEVELMGLLRAQSNFHNHQNLTVGLWYEGTRTGGQERAGDDLVRVAFYALDQLPTLTFPTDTVILESLRERKDSLG